MPFKKSAKLKGTTNLYGWSVCNDHYTDTAEHAIHRSLPKAVASGRLNDKQAKNITTTPKVDSCAGDVDEAGQHFCINQQEVARQLWVLCKRWLCGRRYWGLCSEKVYSYPAN